MAEPILFDWYDYSSFPVPEGTPISGALKVKLQDWAREGDAQLYRGDGWPGWLEWISAWTDRGRALAREVSDELQRPVQFHNELTEEIEDIKIFLRRSALRAVTAGVEADLALSPQRGSEKRVHAPVLSPMHPPVLVPMHASTLGTPSPRGIND